MMYMDIRRNSFVLYVAQEDRWRSCILPVENSAHRHDWKMHLTSDDFYYYPLAQFAAHYQWIIARCCGFLSSDGSSSGRRSATRFRLRVCCCVPLLFFFVISSS